MQIPYLMMPGCAGERCCLPFLLVCLAASQRMKHSPIVPSHCNGQSQCNSAAMQYRSVERKPRFKRLFES